MKKLFALLLSAHLAFGAVAYDTAVQIAYVSGSPGTSTQTLTVAGPNPFVGVCVWEDTAAQFAAVTYNGVSLTRSPAGEFHNTASSLYLSFYYTASAPATGTHNIVIVFTGGQRLGIGFAYKNTAGYDASGSGSTGTAALIFDPVTIVASNAWAAACIQNNNGTTPSAGDGTAGSTVNTFRATDNLGGFLSLFDTNALSIGTGSYSMKVFSQPDHISTNNFGAIGFSLAPVSSSIRHRAIQSRLAPPNIPILSAMLGQLFFRPIR